MDTVIQIFQLLLALSILIVLHEWGHFYAARSFGIRVEKFFLFFDAWGKKLFSFKKGDTEYGVGWLPLGGYVKISGMIDESMDKEFLDKEPQEYEFRSKPAWQRLIVMLGGVTVNAILGILIFTCIGLIWGQSYLPMSELKDGIVVGEIGKEVGFENGDKILAVNGEKVEKWSDVLNVDIILEDNAKYTVLRDGNEMDIILPDWFAKRVTADKKRGLSEFINYRTRNYVSPENEDEPKKSNADEIGLNTDDVIIGVNGQDATFYDQFTLLLKENKGKDVTLEVERKGNSLNLTAPVDSNGKLGIFLTNNLTFGTQELGFVAALKYGVNQGVGAITELVKAIRQMFRGRLNPMDSLSGPIQITTYFPKTFDWALFWGLTARLSMVLAFMNLLPIPALDGGHVMFLLIEMFRGKPLNDKALERAQIVGFVLLIALMAFVFGNDIYQMVFK